MAFIPIGRIRRQRRPRPQARPIVIKTKTRKIAKPAQIRVYKPRKIDEVQRILKSILGALNDPLIMVSIFIAAAVAIDYTQRPQDNIILKVAKYFSGEIGTFLTTNAKKIVCLFMLLPGALSTPRNSRLFLAPLILFAAYVIPQSPYSTYVIAAISLRVFFKVNNTTVRAVLMAIVALWVIVATK